jgi:hypothetical protein
MRILNLRAVALSLLPLALAACDKPIAIGSSNTVVVAARDSVWSALQDEIQDAVEPRIFTVRDERIFEVSAVDPQATDWGDFRLVGRVVVIGEAGDPWVDEALQEVDGPQPQAPSVAHARNVWARGQDVTIILLEPGAPPEAAADLVREAGRSMVQKYEAESRARMFATGADSAAADSLRLKHGFWLLAPTVYRVANPAENVVILRNDNPDPSRLIRQLHVAWRPADTTPISAEAALAWRADLASRYTQPPQETRSELAQTRELDQNGARALEIHGVWSNPPGDWPAAGPFITRMVRCPERTYLLDAWLYAPGAAKYPYMIQLETLLDSFRCD